MSFSFKKTIGKNIKIARSIKGLSQEGLGGLLNPSVSQQQIGRWERGEKEPRVETLAKLASVLGVPVDQLTADNAESTASSLVQDVHIRKVVGEVVAEDSRLKLIVQYLEKIIRILEPSHAEEKEKLLDGGQPTPSPKQQMGQD